jgi:hypothetical protein
MQIRRICFIGAAIVCSFRLSAATIAIVKDGKSDYAIEIPPGATETEKLAASELQKYVKQMSGAELTIQDPKSESDKAILIFQARQAIRDVNGKPEPPVMLAPVDADMYDIQVKGDQIRLVGHGPRSVLYAAYAFLDSLGCRFLAPKYEHYQGSAELVPERNTISFDGREHSERPVLAYRKLYVEEGHSHNITNLKQMVEWMPKVGYNVLVVPTNYQGSGKVKWDNWRVYLTPELKKRDITIEVGGHGYQNFINADMEDGTLFKKHPEWFGQDAKGTRHAEKSWVFCTSNPEAVAYLTNNFVTYVKDRPEIQIFDFWPPDGAKWCECDECKKLGTPSDRQALLVNHVREAAKSARPDLRLEVIAYHNAILLPDHVKLDPSVLVDFCPIGQHFDAQINDPSDPHNADYVKALTAWRSSFTGDISIYSYYRKYAWESLPAIIPHYMQNDLQWYASVPVQGVSTYSEPGDWFTYELNHYALAKLAWNPKADVDAIEKEFCAARYGSSAQPAMEAIKTLEDVVRTTCSIPYSTLKSADVIQQALDRVKKSHEAVTNAEQAEKDAGVKHNLQRLGLMCDYASGDLEIQLMRAQKADEAQIREKVKSLETMLHQHEGEGVFLTERMPPGRLAGRFGLKGK